MIFDSQLIAAFIDTFYGYGSYSASFWFVGMEEGGGRTVEENAARIASWERRGRPELTDLYAYHEGIAVPRWFTAHPPVQPTWGKLIRIMLSARGQQSITPDHIRAYQRDYLGRSTADTCLLELLPLPSPSTGHWIYGEHTTLPQLRTRESYKQHYGKPRALHIAQRVREHKPNAVIFYSFDNWYRRWWQLIAGVPFAEKTGPHGTFYLASNGSTSFAIIKHPASKGPTNHYWHWIGQTLSQVGNS
jgi:hypothetical protein